VLTGTTRTFLAVQATTLGQKLMSALGHGHAGLVQEVNYGRTNDRNLWVGDNGLLQSITP
jgi:hypothetical protein